MTLVRDGVQQMISSFGETVTVKPQGDYEATDSSNPIYFEQTASSESNFEETVRVYSSPSDEILKEYGFEEETEALIYNDDNSIDEGDVVEINGEDFLVESFVTNQIGHGPYIWVYQLRGM